MTSFLYIFTSAMDFLLYLIQAECKQHKPIAIA